MQRRGERSEIWPAKKKIRPVTAAHLDIWIVRFPADRISRLRPDGFHQQIIQPTSPSSSVEIISSGARGVFEI